MAELVEAQSEIQKLSGSVNNLAKFKPVENEMRLVLQPFTREVLTRYARKVSMLQKKDIQPGEVLTSLFNRYITKKETEIDGFPFVVSDAELKTIKASLTANEPVE